MKNLSMEKKQEIKEKKISVLKAIMIYKVQLKINKNLDKKLLMQLRKLVRDLNIGKTDIDEKFSKIKSIIFKKEEEKSEKNEDNGENLNKKDEQEKGEKNEE
jgi:hypothetical protein